jgi:hypothetical protein
VQGRRGHATAIELVHLILHQRDERRDDERGPGQQERGKLEAERLARPGRHHRQHVVPVEHGTHEIFLPRAKRLVTEVTMEGGWQVRRHGEPLRDQTTMTMAKRVCQGRMLRR